MYAPTEIHPKTLAYEKMRRFTRDLELMSGDIGKAPELASLLAVPVRKL